MFFHEQRREMKDLFHGMGAENRFIRPPDYLSGDQRPGYIDQTLIGTSPEAQRNVIQFLHKWAIDQYVDQLQQFIGDLAPGTAFTG